MNTECPYCGRVADILGDLSQESSKPKIGDLSFCIQCGYFSKFDQKLSLRQLTKGEVQEVMRNDVLQWTVNSWKKIRKPHLH